MKYRLARPYFSPELSELLKRELKKQKVYLAKVPPKILAQLAKLIPIIEKEGLPSHLILKKLPDPLGWGIFLDPKAKAIPRGELIASYGGRAYIVPQNLPDESAYAFAPLEKMLLLKQEQKALDPERSFHPARQYLLNIDAQEMGNFTRFINHSEEPNIEARLMQVAKNSYNLSPSPLEVIYVAKKKILPGQQLLVCYEDEEKSYWGALKIKPEPILPTTFTLDKNLKLSRH